MVLEYRVNMLFPESLFYWVEHDDINKHGCFNKEKIGSPSRFMFNDLIVKVSGLPAISSIKSLMPKVEGDLNLVSEEIKRIHDLVKAGKHNPQLVYSAEFYPLCSESKNYGIGDFTNLFPYNYIRAMEFVNDCTPERLEHVYNEAVEFGENADIEVKRLFKFNEKTDIELNQLLGLKEKISRPAIRNALPFVSGKSAEDVFRDYGVLCCDVRDLIRKYMSIGFRKSSFGVC